MCGHPEVDLGNLGPVVQNNDVILVNVLLKLCLFNMIYTLKILLKNAIFSAKIL